MAYTFLLNDDNNLVASRREVIMQRSKLVDEIHFLVKEEYKTAENSMSLFSVVLEYILPCSKRYETLELVQDADGYKEYLKYVVPFDTNLSSEAGDIQLQLTFVYVGLDADGNGVQKVRKTRPAKLHVTPVAAWSDIIPDSALSAIDQRIIKTQAQLSEIGYYAEIINENQVDNLVYDDKAETLQLMAGSNAVGNAVSVRDMLDDGIPVIDLNSPSGSGGNSGNNGTQKPDVPEDNGGCGGCNCDDGCNCEDNVVDFDNLTKCDWNDNVVTF